MKPKSVGADRLICSEGEEGKSFFVIADGQVSIIKSVKGGEEQVLTELGPGSVIGEMSLLDGGRRSASVKAIGNCVVLEVNKEEFDALYQASSPFALRFVERIAIDLSMRLRSADDRFLEIFSRTGETMDELKRRFVAIQATLEEAMSLIQPLYFLWWATGKCLQVVKWWIKTFTNEVSLCELMPPSIPLTNLIFYERGACLWYRMGSK